ncbi:serine protease easter-like isoform X2 [Ischnura elegans]|uniref:serine protease easter-like isoform X2 n=1 Tax=Ischnura elegans TaxID=197161 RepID=UPI001ED89103|nr:serine protease easter-like isoform X2 [Ischnura elegans]
MAGKTLGGAYLAAAVVIIASTLWDYSDALELGETCTNPDRMRGTCIGIRSCPPLLSALQAKPLPQSTLDFLRRSQCGFQGRDPLVCCPSTNPPPGSSTTPPPASDNEVTEDVRSHPNLRLLRLDICGPVSEDRIINGQEASLMELPWMALLGYTVRSGSPFKCGGSIINERYILTAAHCVTRLQSNLRLVSIRVGEHNLSSPIDCQVDEESETQICTPNPQNIQVEQVIPHPRYVGKPNLQYDVALVRVSRPIDFTHDAVRPICLPVELGLQTQNLVGKKVVVSGWGATEKLQPSPVLLKVSVPVMSYPDCSDAFRGVVPISRVTQLCAGGVRNGGDSCSGDSGGPLTYFGQIQTSTRTIQHGIVSYGPKNCGSPGQPGVYTRVGHYMKWILDNMKA